MFEVGREHDGWYVDAQLGVGGMGAVYRCHKVSLPEVVTAIKVVIQTDLDAKARFRREAAALNKLAHDNVVRFRDVQCLDEPWYIVMDLAEGRPLKDMIGETLPLPRLLGLASQLASAVSYVHSKGLRHRDLKPANVIVDTNDRLVLVDFGIAVRKEDPRITIYGRCGSPSYAPPEWRAPDVDEEAWDVYSLGQVLHELCTGQEAFPADSIDEVMYLKRGTPALDPGESVPRALRDLIGAATALDPRQRPKAEVLARALEGMRVPRPPPPPPLAEVPTLIPHKDSRTVPVPDPVLEADPARHVATTLPAAETADPALPVLVVPPPGPREPPKRSPLGRLGVVMLAILLAIGACFGLG